MRHIVSRLNNLAGRVNLRSRKAAVLLAGSSVAAFSSLAGATTTYSGAMPTGLQPSDMLTVATGEIKPWLTLGIPALIGFFLLARFVKGLTRGGSRAISH